MLRLNAVYLEVGRGHPFYLDGAVRAIRSRMPNITIGQIDLIQDSHGLARVLWKGVNRIYRLGSRGGKWEFAYSRLRSGRHPDKRGIAEGIVSRELKRLCEEKSGIFLVSHPRLIPIFNKERVVLYVHGEHAAPSEAVVAGAEIIFVPTERTKMEFVRQGGVADRVFVTGLCIEESLGAQAETAYTERIRRLKGSGPLTVAIFSSGAEPPLHMEKILSVAESLRNAGMNALIFCQTDKKLEGLLWKRLRVEAIPPANIGAGLKAPLRAGEIYAFSYMNRQEENDVTGALFHHFDCLVAPSHERTNWALGLGLPIFILHPLIGPYAPLNRRILMEHGVARDIPDDKTAMRFAAILCDLRRAGTLMEMSSASFGMYEINGFEKIGDYIIRKFKLRM